MASVKQRLVRSFLVTAGCLGWAATSVGQGLTVEIVNGYNLVVDSNVTAPSTYGPRSAYIGARVCNTTGGPLANVFAYVGNYNGGVGSTPGVFPVKTFGPDPARPHLAGTGNYSLTIEGGTTGSADGARYVGTLAAGECRQQYWLFSYPQCVNVAGQPQAPPCDVSITGSVQPGDDLALDYDVWATTTTGGVTPAVGRRSFTMRNEISAAANKIWPNNAAKVPDEYLAAIQSVVGWGTLGPDGQPISTSSSVYPGQRLITTQGVWYDLGTVGQGFDNDGDLIPDQNAWLQPIGDPGAFDAGCFRMVNVYGLVIVRLVSGGELLIPFQNRLYFEHLPDNTGVVGLVYYQFVATDGPCSASTTPYQEAASGFDNEKFSADYGLGLGLSSRDFGANLVFTKSDGVTTTSAGSTLTYTLAVPTNNTGVHLGAPDLGVPLTIRETIPAGTTYVPGSALAGLVPPSGSGTYQQGYTGVDGVLDTCTVNYTVASSSFQLFYSTDGGTTWTLSEPPPASVTDVRWDLLTTVDEDGGHDGRDCVAPDGAVDRTLPTSLPAGQTTSVTVQVLVGSTAGPVLCDAAFLGVGGATGGTQAEDCDIVSGNNSLSGRVFRDDGTGGGLYGNGVPDGAETGIGAGVIVTLYYDRNGDGTRDAGDLVYASTTSAADGTFSFGSLADGPYLVVVNKYDGATSNGANDAATDAFFGTRGWGNTTFDPNLPLTTAQGILRLGEDLLTATLAVNIDLPRATGAAQSVAGVNFGFAPPFRLTKSVTGNPDASPVNGVADTPVDEGDLFSYTLLLENRLPSVGRQGPTGCQYTVWATTGQTGSVAGNRNFSSPGSAYDAPSPNLAVASALVEGGGNRWLFGNNFAVAPQNGTITKVEGLYFGYFSQALTDDRLDVDVGRFPTPPALGPDGITGLAATSTGVFSTAQIDSYIGAPPDTDPDRAIAWNITALRPGGGAWQWADFASVYLQVNPTKSAGSDTRTFFLDAVGLRVTTDAACEASASTTLDPVPLQDTYDTARSVFVASDPPATSVNLATGVIQWSNVGPILPGTSRVVTVTMRALDVAGLVTGSCAAAPGTITNTGCNYATTDFSTGHVGYADGRLANDAASQIAVSIQGKAELRGVAWNDVNGDGWPNNDGEPGLPAVGVTLWACRTAAGTLVTASGNNRFCANQGGTWQVLATTVTNTTGAYEFIGLDSGYYLIEVGNSDGAPVTGNVSPYGSTQSAEPNDTQASAGGLATGTAGLCAGAGGCNNTWGNPGAELLANQSQINFLDAATEETVGGVNFGYRNVQAALYGNVWQDTDGDAVREAGDLGLAGFTVLRYTDPNGDGNPSDGVLQASTTTDVAGNYAFTGVAPGAYVLVVIPATLRNEAWVETVESTGGTASLNNQIPVTLLSGQVSGSHDFGYTRRSVSSIGDTVYVDVNGNGYQDLAADGTPLEAGIPNVTVWLYQDVDRDGTVDAGVDALLATTVTGASGQYSFQNLAGGSYVVRVDTTDADFPTDVTASGDADVNMGRIGDFVWLDADGDGVQDAGEPGLANVVVTLYSDADGDGVRGAGDPLVAATVTNAAGNYLFTSLSAGRYFVDVDETTLPNAALTLSTPDPVGTLVTLATNASVVLSADAGYSQAGGVYVLGDRVWSDADGDGVQDAGEVGIAGVRVTVTGGSCATPCVTLTDAAGFWFVAGLANGNYTASVDATTLPRDFQPTAPSAAPSNTRNVTIAGADVTTADFGYRYNTDGNLTTRDTGDPTGSISGRVYLDANGNGSYDAGEGRGGATVNLLDADNNVIASTVTAADGSYSFASAANTGIFIGQYTVQSLDALGTRFSVLFVSASLAFPNLNIAYSQAVETVPDGTSAVSVDGVHADLTQDFGFLRFQGSIGDTIYQDANENATQDPGEPGIAGVTVNLYVCAWIDANGNDIFESGEQSGCGSPIRSVTTSADDPLTAADEGGKYLFPNLSALPANQYYLVEVVTATLPGSSPTLIADPDTDGLPCTQIPPPPAPGYPPQAVCDSLQLLTGGFTGDANYLGADFGYRLTGSGYGLFGDRLWLDTNGNGALDLGELGLQYVTVWLDGNGNGLLDWVDANGNGRWDAGEGERWTETDSDGSYLFTGLSDGTYDVRVLTGDPDWPAGLPTTPTFEVWPGNTASLDSRVQVVVSGGAVTALVDGDPATPDACTGCGLNADFGYRYPGTRRLSGTLCLDDAGGVGYCGATATTYSGTAPGSESPLAGVQVFLYRWLDDGDNAAWDASTGAFDAGDTFTALGATTTSADGDYAFANVPDDVVVLFAMPPQQELRLTTTNANTSVEDTGVISRQLWDGSVTYLGQSVTVVARQALNLGGDADGDIVDLDFGFLSPVQHDFGDLPDPDAGTPDYNATLLISGGARHRIGAVRLGAGNTFENDGYDSPTASGDAGDDGITGLLNCGAMGGGVRLEVVGATTAWFAGWLDFNGDGDFADAGELIINQQVVQGEQIITFDMPDPGPNCVVGSQFFTRFRLYPSQPLIVASTGIALDRNFEPTSGEVEDYVFPVVATQAVVSSFSATRTNGGVALEWETASEIGTVGFYLRRFDAATGVFVDVNSRLLPSLVLTPQGGLYRYVDPEALPGVDQRYELIEATAWGPRRVLGTWTVNTDRTSRDTVQAERWAALAEPDASGYAKLAHARQPAPATRATAAVGAARSVEPATQAKVRVGESGVYFVATADLAARGGLATGPANWAFSQRGLPVAFLPAADQSGAYFYGQELDSPFTRDNVYWVDGAARAGLRMSLRGEPDGLPPAGGETFLRHVHRELDQYAAPSLFDDGDGDYWIWDWVVGGDEPKPFPFRAEGLTAGFESAVLTLGLKGGNDTPAAVDHRVRVRINGNEAGEIELRGTRSVETRLEFDARWLVDGDNVLELEALAGDDFSLVFVDAFDVDYPSRYQASANRLEFTSAGHAALRVAGFTRPDVMVFDVTDPRAPVYVHATPTPDRGGTYGVTLFPTRPDQRYFAVTPDAVLPVSGIEPDRPSQLRGTDNRAAYLVITTAALKPAAQRLADYRSDLSSQVIDVVDVYDEFNAGLPSPHALRDFLDHAYTKWAERPRYVVLAGDGSFDYKDAFGAGDNLVPPMMVNTIGGLAASDTWFGNVVQGGPAPEIAVGRLPARDAAELEAMIDKIQAREAGSGSAWRRRLLLVADNPDVAGDFVAGSERVAAAAARRGERIYLSALGLDETRRRLLSGIDEGTGDVNYVGHAGYEWLADEGILGQGDVGALTNSDRPTFLSALTCVAGDFSVPGYPSLGEVLVRQPAGAAAGVWSATGLSHNELAVALGAGYYATGVHDPQDRRLRVGDAVVSAMRSVERGGGASWMLAIYELLGDPAMWLE